MENNIDTANFQDFYMYLKEPTLFEQLNEPRALLNDPVFKRFKTACNKNPELIVKTIEFISKNMSLLDNYKVGVTCSIFSELTNLTEPQPIISNFILGFFIRTMVLADRYIHKSLSFVENSTIFAGAPEELRAWKCMDIICEPVSIILSSSIPFRNKFRENKNYFVLINRLKPFVEQIEIIYNIYRLTDNTEIIMIHPEKQIGLKLLLNSVQNNYHLFTLAQFELAEKVGNILGISANKYSDALQIAKGLKKYDIHRKIPVEAIIGFYPPKSFQESKRLNSPLWEQEHLNGTYSPLSLPNFEGQKIIFISAPSKSLFQWNSSEFKPINKYLLSEVKILEIIDKKIVSDIISRI